MPVRVLVFAEIDPSDGEGFEEAFKIVRERVAATSGPLSEELLRAEDEPGSYVLLAEWESREAFLGWEDDPVHREMTTPLRPYWGAGHVKRTIYEVRVPRAERGRLSDGTDGGEGATA
jgi:heme-degrading monooxygenase HmoA